MHFTVSSLCKDGPPVCALNIDPSVDLERVDPYSLESFRDLLNLRIREGLDFYVVSLKEGNHFYFFEASRFIEQIFRKNSRNPLTNIEISYFEILRYSEKNDNFELYCDSNQIKEPIFYATILINDPTRTGSEKRKYLHKLGCSYLREKNYNLDKAIEYLRQAAEEDFEKSQQLLGYVMLDNNKIAEGSFWLGKYLQNNPANPVSEFLYLAETIIEFDPEKSFKLFEKMAFRGSYPAIAKIVGLCEEDGVLKDLAKARMWRKLLPSDWQEGSVNNFISHLQAEGYDFNSTAQLAIPPELLP